MWMPSLFKVAHLLSFSFFILYLNFCQWVWWRVIEKEKMEHKV